MLRNRDLSLWSRLLILNRKVIIDVKEMVGDWIVGKYWIGNNLRSQAEIPTLTNQHLKQKDEINNHHQIHNHSKVKLNKKRVKKIIKRKAVKKINKLKMIK